MTSVLFVRVEDLPKTPQAFREYVATFFAQVTFMGLECMVATRYTAVNFSSGIKKGRAPSHNVDLRRYMKGLRRQHLNDWIRKNNGRLVHELYLDDDGFFRGSVLDD